MVLRRRKLVQLPKASGFKSLRRLGRTKMKNPSDETFLHALNPRVRWGRVLYATEGPSTLVNTPGHSALLE
jgi:hypothetical protein